MNSDSLAVPAISVVIPTRNRANLAERAIRSALLQSYRDIEVIVVVDGGDTASYASHVKMDESRVRVLSVAQSVGGGEARNIGIMEARGEWIALLDDDDEWLSDKLQSQIDIARYETVSDALICCQYFERTKNGQIIRPSRVPRPMQSISEYLFCEVPLMGSRLTFLQTSTWLARRDLFLRIPFEPSVRMNDDTDWLLRAIKDPSRQITVIQKPLSIYHCDGSHTRMNTANAEIEAGEVSRRWAKWRGELFTPKALAHFFVTDCLPHAVSANRGWRVYADILKDCWEMGSVTPTVLWLFFRATVLFPSVKYCLPTYLRQRICSLYIGREVNAQVAIELKALSK